VANASPKVYWESSPFVATLWNETGRAHICQAVLQSARNGEIELYTSMLTLVEVFKVPDSPQEEVAEQVLTDFFRNRWIRKVEVDWFVAQEARSLQRRFPRLDGRDATHLATAVYLEVGTMHTYDRDDLLRLNGQIPHLVIQEPAPFGTLPMDLRP